MAKFRTVDEYIALAQEEDRAALRSFRKLLHSIIPGYEEVISYQIPVLKYKGKMLVGFAGYKDHLSFMVMSPQIMERISEDVKRFKGSTATLHFTPQKPLPEILVRKIVEARILETEHMLEAKKAKAASDSDREVVISRTFDAPRELVYSAWTEQKHLHNWFGPLGFKLTIHELDFRVGGVWRFIMHGPDGVDYPNRIDYLKIDPPKKLIYRHSDDGLEAQLDFETAVTFAKKGKKTEVTMRTVFPTAEERDRIVKDFGAIEGGKQTLARLAEYLTTL